MGAFSRFLSRHPAGSAERNLSALAPHARIDVGDFGGAVSDWIVASADVRTAFAWLQSAMVRGLRRHGWNCLRALFRCSHYSAGRKTGG